MLVATLAIAGVLAVVRVFSRRPSPNNQFLYDMLGIWTVIELLLIVGADLDSGVIGFQMPDVAEIIKSNGALLPFALTYCAWAVGLSTIAPTIAQFRSADKEGD